MSGFNFENLFQDQVASSELPAGVHENVKLISVDISKRKDFNGKALKKQLFLKFKKYDNEGRDIGEKEVDFFLLDPEKKEVINHLRTYIEQVMQLLKLYYTEEELLNDEKGLFDPLAKLFNEDTHALGNREDGLDSDFAFDNIKKNVLNKNSMYKEVSEAINTNFFELIEDKIGVDSDSFRLKLIESKDKEFIQIPQYSKFVERTSVSKEDSELYNQ